MIDMEHKIGEIFEYNGEWYQCINKGFSCADCDIKGDCSSIYIYIYWCLFFSPKKRWETSKVQET